MLPIIQLLLAVALCTLLAVAANEALAGAEPAPRQPSTAATLDAVAIDARDLKTLHYMENAHGQLEEWSLRLLSRLENGLGPRDDDPILNGRADLQVQKIAITYAGYTRTAPLGARLRDLAEAHQARLDALKRMVAAGPDRSVYENHDAPVQAHVQTLRQWSQKR